MRSDWTEDATFATFRCGRFGEIDGTWGRNNADNLSFTIRKRGPLAIDSGPVHHQNLQVLRFFGNEENSDAAVNSTIGVLGWRVELRRRESATVVEFLHLLQVGASADAFEPVARATLTSTTDRHVLRFQQGSRTYDVAFARTGKRGGSLDINGTPMPVPDTIEDHWRHHRDDANFRTWVTDPRYRITIEPTDADRAAAG